MFVTIWMDLEGIKLGEIKKTTKNPILSPLCVES